MLTPPCETIWVLQILKYKSYSEFGIHHTIAASQADLRAYVNLSHIILVLEFLLQAHSNSEFSETQARARGSPLQVLAYKDGSCFLTLMYSHFPYCIPLLTVSSLTNALEHADRSNSTTQYHTDSGQCQMVS